MWEASYVEWPWLWQQRSFEEACREGVSSVEDRQDIAWMHNPTHGKCLGFQTPLQAILKQMGINATISFLSGVALQT